MTSCHQWSEPKPVPSPRSWILLSLQVSSLGDQHVVGVLAHLAPLIVAAIWAKNA